MLGGKAGYISGATRSTALGQIARQLGTTGFPIPFRAVKVLADLRKTLL